MGLCHYCAELREVSRNRRVFPPIGAGRRVAIGAFAIAKSASLTSREDRDNYAIMKRVPIRLHTANALKWLGSLYRNPADAIKEHVSNAIDEHLKAIALGRAASCCTVSFTLTKSAIAIEYPYGMSSDEFRQALQMVADSAKRTLDVNPIGQLGIGIFSFLQLGRKCTFFSKKGKGFETVKVTLREGADDAEFEERIHDGSESPDRSILPRRPQGHDHGSGECIGPSGARPFPERIFELRSRPREAGTLIHELALAIEVIQLSKSPAAEAC